MSVRPGNWHGRGRQAPRHRHPPARRASLACLLLRSARQARPAGAKDPGLEAVAHEHRRHRRTVVAGLFHVAVKTNDLEATVAFYTRILGLRNGSAPISAIPALGSRARLRAGRRSCTSMPAALRWAPKVVRRPARRRSTMSRWPAAATTASSSASARQGSTGANSSCPAPRSGSCSSTTPRACSCELTFDGAGERRPAARHVARPRLCGGQQLLRSRDLPHSFAEGGPMIPRRPLLLGTLAAPFVIGEARAAER